MQAADHRTPRQIAWVHTRNVFMRRLMGVPAVLPEPVPGFDCAGVADSVPIDVAARDEMARQNRLMALSADTTWRLKDLKQRFDLAWHEHERAARNEPTESPGDATT